MHLSRVDLNLFVVFDAIAAEGSITRAAQRLNLTQPAVSHALARLRELYRDPLFVRAAKGMEPTPLTRQMMGPVREALGQLHGTLMTGAGFEPGAARETFTVSLPDVLETRLLPGVMAALQRQAPGVRLNSVRIPRRALEAELAAGRLDLAFDVPIPVSSALRHEPLSDARFRVVMRPDHPLLSCPWTVEAYLNAQHVAVSSRRTGLTAEDLEWSRLGLRRDVVLRCTHYHVAWRTVAASDLLLTLPAHYVDAMPAGELAVLELPVDLRGLVIHMMWHESVDASPASCWLRSLFREQARVALDLSE